MKIADIMNLTSASKATIYRWMESHPTLTVADPSSPLGHSFPKPFKKEGRVVIWDGAEVEEWWRANERTIGRHPEESTVIEMPWDRFRLAMQKPPAVYEDEDGNEIVEDHMAGVIKYEARDGIARIWFHDLNDAVLFKLTYA